MKFRRRSTVVDAVQWDGSTEAFNAIRDMGADFRPNHDTWYLVAGSHGAQGQVRVPLHHWVLKGDEADFWPVDPEVFEQTYEPAP